MTVTDDIKQRLDIVDLITTGGVALRKAGRNWTGFCPFHPNTRTPAFYVFPETQSYYCFGCHEAGDAFNWIMKRQGLDFGTALEQLAARAGIALQAPSPQQEAENSRQTLLRQINEDAAVYWHHLLRNTRRGEPGRSYAGSRGLDEQAWETWQLGYAPADWSDLLVYLTDRKSHAPEDIEAAGLVIQREGGGYYDRFRNRLIFPIRNHKGVIVGFGGRTLGDDHAKYMNTPETPLFHKGMLLFGLYEGREAIRQHDSVVLVEGYLDVITAHQAGFRNVVAAMGTALTGEQVGVIKKLTRTITLALDADAAGTNATLRGLETLRDNLSTNETAVVTPQGLIRWERELDGKLQIAVLPPGRDPDDVIRADPQLWRELIAAAKPLLDFYLQVLTADLDLLSAKGRSQAVERLAPLVAAVSDAIERAHYTQELARLVGLQESVVAGAIQAARRGRAMPPVLPADSKSSAGASHTREDEILSLLLRFPEIQPKIEEVFRGELARFPQLNEVMSGDLGEAFRRTENREIWAELKRRPREPHVPPVTWTDGLEPTLGAHAKVLVQLPHTSPLPVPTYETESRSRAAHLAEAIALELRKVVVHQRRQQKIAQLEAVEDPDERQRLIGQLTVLNEYQSIVTAPRRSTYFQDLGTRLEHLG